MRVTYCMQRDQITNQLCSTEIPWERFVTHGAVCDSCEKKKQITAKPTEPAPFKLEAIATYAKP